jgi:Kef-type K+ transport system membrane component KefB
LNAAIGPGSALIDSPLLVVGLLLVLGFFGGRLANRAGLPRITGYLAVGVLFSPSVTGIVPRQVIFHDLHVITEVALAIIAFTIGGSLEFRRLRHVGYQIGWITIFQALGAFSITALVLYPVLGFMVHLPGEYGEPKMLVAISLVMGAIAAATAPGAVLAIISELRAKGTFTTILLGVIALDDAITIVFYAVAATIAQNLITPGSASMLSMVTIPAIDIGLSLVVGALGGVLLYYSARTIDRPEAMLMVVMGVLILVSTVSSMVHASALLANMVVGLGIVNVEHGHQDYFRVMEPMEDMVFGLFFTLAGAHIEIEVLKVAGLLALIFLAIRMVGKQLGVWAGVAVSGADHHIKRYLGLALFPQAGVTIGLVMLAQDIFPDYVGELVVNAVLGSVILNEFISPPLLKFCLRRVGDAR